MIDVGEKADTKRRAIASGNFYAQTSTLLRIKERTLPKGDVLMLAVVAGIQGAKKTSDLLPLCHPLFLSSVRVWFECGTESIRAFCEAKTIGKTGVEMEALVGVNAALLCLYDLTKGIDPTLDIGNIRLDLKEGGKSGYWRHPRSEFQVPSAPSQSAESSAKFSGLSVSVITLSDRCSRGEAIDESGPSISTWFKERGAAVASERILPDEDLRLQTDLHEILKKNPSDFIILTGGTGLSKRDVTPETLSRVAQEFGGREIPGLGELLRKSGSEKTLHAWLSRSTGYIIGSTLLIALPGSVKAVQESLNSLEPILKHAIHTVRGGTHPSQEGKTSL